MEPADYYKPPRADLDAPAPAGTAALPAKLYTTTQVGVATFLGGPLAGALLMAGNYRATNRSDSARKAVIFGVIGTIVLVVLALALPDGVPSSSLSIVSTLSVLQTAKSLQGPWLTPHFGAGGAKQSNWRVAGIALGCLAALVAMGLVAGALTVQY